MELVQDFVFTASVAIVLSFFVAKLLALALATSDRPSPPPQSNSTDTDEVHEMLKVQEACQSQTQLEKKAAEVKEVDRCHVAAVEKAAGVECPREEVEEEISESGQVDADVDDCGREAEGKMGNYSDEDDWEGIEKSEVDEGYTAAVKSEGG